ncbi:MAG: DUF2341 domain-containing protein [Fibrobacter sp.]|nr:DUF2341 domain-containing protein [Fibrobacter sp.]
MIPSLLRLTIYIASSLLIFCNHPSIVNNGGGGSEVEIVGVIYNQDGPAPRTQVKLIQSNYNPLIMSPIVDSMIDTTDALGRYRFKNISSGQYNVQAVHLSQRTRLLVTGIEVTTDKFIIVSRDTLRKPGSIRLKLSTEAASDGYLSIPGTDITTTVSAGSNEILLDSVPAGTIPEIRYYTADDTVPLIKRNVTVVPSHTTILEGPPVTLKKMELLLNTTVNGAGVQSDIYNFPVLVRLSETNFDFSSAATNGKDITFTNSNNVVLPHEIERWNSATKQAEIWVKIDTIHGNDSTQSIYLQWGAPSSTDQSNGSAVFDTAAGFQGVWHLSESVTDSSYDATINRYTGTSPDNATPASGTGQIGNCRIFNGTSDFITMNNTSESKLNFPESGYYTVSAWVYLDTFDNSSRCIVSKGYEQYFLRSTYISLNVLSIKPLWEFVEFSETQKWQALNGSASSKQWVFLAGVREGNRQFLYCNGDLIDSTIDKWPNAVSRNTGNNLYIGRFATPVTIPANDGYCFFKGGIDEVRIQSRSLHADWIKLCYMNQRSDDKLIVYKKH